MPTPALRHNFVDTRIPLPGELTAAEYNLNAERTDEAWDKADAAADAAATAQADAELASQAAAGAYHKPAGGIPEADLSAAVQAKLNDGGTGGGPVSSDDITDATDVGRASLTAANQAAGRAAIAAASAAAVDAAQTTADLAQGTATAAGSAAAGAQQDAEAALSAAAAAQSAAGAAQATANAAATDAGAALAALPGKADDGDVAALDTRLTTLEGAPPGSGPSAYRANVGNDAAGPYTITHNKNTLDFIASIFKNPGHVDNLGDGSQVFAPVKPIDLNTALIDTTETWSLNSKRILLWPMPGGDVTPPAAVTLNEVSKTQTTISVSATGAAGAASFAWLRAGAEVARTAANTYNHTGLTAGQPYTVAVRAYDLAGNVVQSANVVITTTASGDTTPPTAPNTPALVSKTQTSVTMTLGGGTDNVGVTGYHVYRGGVKITGAPVAAGNYTDTGRTQNTPYVYASTAVDAVGLESPLSGNLNVTTDAAATSITVDATSAIARQTVAGATISTDVTITLADAADYLAVRASASVGSGATDWAAYDTLTATVISINGGTVSIPLTRRGSANIGTQNLGSVHLFDLVNPAAGTFVIRVSVGEAGSSFSDLRAIARSYIGVGTIGTPVVTSSFSGAMSNVVTGPPAVGDKVLFIGAWSSTTGGDSFAGGTPFYSAYFNVTGVGDYVIAADTDGAGSNVTYSAASGPQSGSVAVRLQKAA